MSEIIDHAQSDIAARNKNIRITVISIVAVMVLFLGLFLNKVLVPRPMTDTELRHHNVVLFEQPRELRQFSLVDEDAEPFQNSALESKLTLLFFGFTHCPDICPTTLLELGRIYNKLPESVQNKVQIGLVSLDPTRDTTNILKPYVEYFNKDFKGLTGEFREILKITADLNIAFNKVILEEGYTVDHSSQVIIINQYGDFAGFIKAPMSEKQMPRIIESTLIKL
jgi:protein SCO1/2